MVKVLVEVASRAEMLRVDDEEEMFGIDGLYTSVYAPKTSTLT